MAVYDVFISYSGADRDLAEEVHRALVRAELSVWRDRDRLAPGLRFTPQIFEALRLSSVCLCLVSEAYLNSGYANQEAGAAHSFGIRLFPVRLGAVRYEQLVGVIRDEHVPTFGQDLVDIEAIVEAVAGEIVDSRRGIHGSAAPSLPVHYIERAELRPVIVRLTQQSIPWLAITGRPGSGRSTFAAALAAALAPSLDRRVFWVERQSSEPGLAVHLQRQLLEQLTDGASAFETWQNGRRLLRRYAAALPRSTRCVLVLDDADAEPSLLPAFDIDSRWTVIAVGQDPAAFAPYVAPDHVVRLGGLSVEEAEMLAARIVAVPPDTIPPDAHVLFEKIDRLPAAITLAGTLARTSVDPGAVWRDLLDAVDEGTLHELKHPAVLRGGVPALIRAALRPLTTRQKQAIALLGVLPDGFPFDLAQLQRVWSLKKERDIRALASRLRELSLIDDGAPGFRVPSLIRTYLRHEPRFATRYVRVLASLYPDLSPLIAAILWNDRDAFELLLPKRGRSAGRRPSTRTSRQRRPPVSMEARYRGFHALHFAVQSHQAEMVLRLLRAGAPVDVPTDPDQQTPLHLAVHHAQPHIASVLIDEGADVNGADSQGITPLHVAAQLNEIGIATRLLQHGADPRARNRHGNSPLHIAALFGADHVADLLTKHDPELVTLEGESGTRPLLFAAARGHAPTLGVLLHAGADPEDALPSGNVALHLAVYERHDDAVEQLLAARADVDRAVDGVTALYLASQEGHTSLVQRLLLAGADPSGGRSALAGTSAIHAAAHGGYGDVVRLLVHAGALVDIPDDAGRTALHYAAQSSTRTARTTVHVSIGETGVEAVAGTVIQLVDTADMVEFLLSAGASVDARSDDGNTALHVAARAGAASAIRALLAAGADTSIRNSSDMTAAEVARDAGHPSLADAIDTPTPSARPLYGH